MKYLEMVWVEDLDRDWGNVYDKPYHAAAGQARRIIGRWDVMRRWKHGRTPMASFRVELGPIVGYGKRRTDWEGAMNVYQTAQP